MTEWPTDYELTERKTYRPFVQRTVRPTGDRWTAYDVWIVSVLWRHEAEDDGERGEIGRRSLPGSVPTNRASMWSTTFYQRWRWRQWNAARPYGRVSRMKRGGERRLERMKREGERRLERMNRRERFASLLPRLIIQALTFWQPRVKWWESSPVVYRRSTHNNILMDF